MPTAARTWRRTSPLRPCASRARRERASGTCRWSSCRHLLRDGHGCGMRCVGVPAETEMAVRLRPISAGNRDVELGVAPHAVLVDVEALRLDDRLDADAPDLVEHPQSAERRTERKAADGDQAEALHAELVERPR